MNSLPVELVKGIQSYITGNNEIDTQIDYYGNGKKRVEKIIIDKDFKQYNQWRDDGSPWSITIVRDGKIDIKIMRKNKPTLSYVTDIR